MTLKRNGATLVAPFLLYFEYDLTTLFKHPHIIHNHTLREGGTVGQQVLINLRQKNLDIVAAVNSEQEANKINDHKTVILDFYNKHSKIV
jgi:hypothetical protein